MPSTRPGPTLPQEAYSQKPFIAIWETTRACDLACRHCRASAQSMRDPLELGPNQALSLISQVAEWKVPLFVMTGGDPLKRPDLMDLVAECSRRGMTFALAPSVTPLLTEEKLVELRDAGLHRISLSLDGADPATHDVFRGVAGSFEQTLESMRLVRKLGIHLQVNTSVGRHNAGQLPSIVELIRPLGIDLWSVFFLVPTGRATRDQMLSAPQVEEALRFLYRTLERGWFDIKTTEAPHFRRVVLQENGISPGELPEKLRGMGEGSPLAGLLRAARGVNDGRGFVFISHRGDVYPSGFFPVPGGNIRRQPLREIYGNSPVFTSLRDADKLKGKCGECEYRFLCGGSRARALAMTGDPLASDPLCVYQPGGR